jgi:D-tyrosyl-tRNA(Tyr) deacylase
MIALIQRVREAWVDVEGRRIALIGPGLLALIGVQRADREAEASRLLRRLLGYRIFADPDGRMNLDLKAVAGGLLLVPQFTLAANTRKGLRPSFDSAADPAHGRIVFDALVASARNAHQPVAVGRFGAEMLVGLVNDGPVTFWLDVKPPPG